MYTTIACASGRLIACASGRLIACASGRLIACASGHLSVCLQPLHIEVGESLVAQVNDVLAAGASRNENEVVLRNMFDGCRAALSGEISEQLADFRNKRDLGTGDCAVVVFNGYWGPRWCSLMGTGDRAVVDFNESWGLHCCSL